VKIRRGYMKEKSKVVRIKSELLEQLSNLGNISENVTKLIANYCVTDVTIKQDDNYNFFFCVNDKEIPFNVTGVTTFFGISNEVYDKLMRARILPEESISSVIFRLLAASSKEEDKRPFILKIGRLHKKLLDTLDNYDIAGYHFSDIVEGVPSTADETCLIVRGTGKTLLTLDKPFEENYSFRERYTQLTPDMMVSICHMKMNDYEMSTGTFFIYRAEIKRFKECER
jgi:hypothetical protein